MCVQYKSFKNTAEKEKLLMMNNFSFSHGKFYPFHWIKNCYLQSLSVWEESKICHLGKGKEIVAKEKILATTFSFSTETFSFPLNPENTTKFYLSESKSVAYTDKLNMSHTLKVVFTRVEIKIGKAKNAG